MGATPVWLNGANKTNTGEKRKKYKIWETSKNQFDC